MLLAVSDALRANISGKGNDMGMWCDIQSHSTRTCPLPLHLPQSHAHKLLVHSCPQSMHTNLLISFDGATVLPGFKYYSLPSTSFSVGGWATVRDFPQKGWNSFSEIHTYSKNFVFLLHAIVLPILQLTVHRSMCCASFISVVFICLLFLQIGNTLWNCMHAWQWQIQI